jgi:hypothetical protein
MPAVDFESAWVDLKAYVMSRASHGQRDLLREITRIEIDRRIPEGEEGFSDLPLLRRRRTPAERAPA